jgi:ABC-type transporter Mla MlaB component
MDVSRSVGLAWQPLCPVLHSREPEGEFLLLTIFGPVVDELAVLLWADIEEALERASGRAVRVDLSGVTGFDHAAVRELADTARACTRRRVDLQLIVRAHSALEQYLHWYAPDQQRSLTRPTPLPAAPGAA